MTNIKNGIVVVINNRPCKVRSHTTTQPGKHGARRTTGTAVDVITGKTCEFIFRHRDKVVEVSVITESYPMLDYHDSMVSYLANGKECYERIQQDSELGEKLTELLQTNDACDLEISILSAEWQSDDDVQRDQKVAGFASTN